MDFATLIGVLGALIGIVMANVLEGGDPSHMINVPAMLLVFVGTFGVGLAGGSLKDFISGVISAKNAFASKLPTSGDSIETIVKLAETARREGLLALEDALKSVDDPFLKRGLELAVDGTDPDELYEILEAEVRAKKEKDKPGIKLFADMGGYAPTIGIIGTVLGLVHVLGSLSDPDPAKLGHGIAGAFIATLWGVLLANVVCLPVSSKLKRIMEMEVAQMEVAIEGIMAIQSGANPRTVDRKLRALMPVDEKKAA